MTSIGKDKLTEEQVRNLVEHTFDKNYLVEAGAGAGKSTMIVNRIINQLLAKESPVKENNEPIKLSEIIAITFTEKAANELQFKFQKELRNRINDSTISASDKQILSQAMLELDAMFINTVHAFCSKLLNEMPFTAGLTIGFEPMDEKENSEFKQKVWEKFITLEENNSSSEKIIKLRNEGIAPNDLIDFFMDACENQSLGINLVSNSGVENTYDRIKETLWDLYNYFKQINYKDIKKGKFKEHPFDLLTSIFKKSELNEKRKVLDFTKELIKVSCPKDLLNAKSKNYKNLNDINDVFDVEKIKNLYDTCHEYRYNLSLDFITDALNLYVTEKKRQMKVSFNDLLYKTYVMLRDSKEARAFFQKKYKCIYVDEFQDTDPIQTKILYLLTDSHNLDNSDWEKCEPKAGSLFLVGDPKQSIYRFRQADISVYNKVKMMVAGVEDWETVALEWNFRSNPEICEWVENHFKIQPCCNTDEDELTEKGTVKFYLNETSKAHQTIFTGMKSKSNKVEENPEVVRGVYSYLIEDKDADAILKLDSYHVASWIKKQVEDGIQIAEYNYKTGENTLRPVKYGDFLILLKTTKGMASYINELKQQSIPVSFAGKLNLYSLHEAANLIDMVSYLDDQKNIIKLMGILKNGFNIDLTTINFNEINKIADENESCETDKNEKSKPKSKYLGITRIIYDDKKIEKLTDENLKHALQTISIYRSWKYQFLPITALEKIVDSMVGLLKEEYDRINFRSAASTLYYILELVKAQEYSSFNALAQKIEELKNIDIDREMPIEYDQDENGEYNSIRIMNLHKAKGLEGNIVILAKPLGDKKFEPTKHTSRADDIDTIHMCVVKKYGAIGTTLATPTCWRVTQEVESEYSNAERLRLLYVAATRAAKVLVISHANYGRSPSPWRDLIKEEEEKAKKKQNKNGNDNKSKIYKPLNTQKIDVINRDLTVETYTKSSKDNCEKLESDIAELMEKKELKIKNLSAASFYEISPSQLDKDKSSSAMKNTDKLNEVRDEDEEEPNDHKSNLPYGPVWGTIVHRMFELYINKVVISQETADQIKEIIIKQAIKETLEQTKLNNKTVKQLKLSSDLLKLTEKEIIVEAISKLLPALTEILSNFQNNNDMNELLSSSEQIITEMPFYITVNKESDNPKEQELYNILFQNNKEKENEGELKIERSCNTMQVSGIMDLVLRTGNQYTIIDYKTNHYRKDIKQYLREVYQLQLTTYKQILELMTGGEVELLITYSTVIDEQILI